MVGELSFKNLPFVPEEGEVIYVEQSYHKKLNKFIRNNYEWLRKNFSHHHLSFCYLPLRAEETISYHAPYLTAEERQAKIGLVPSLLNYVVGDADIKPSLVFALNTPKVDAPCDIVLQSVIIDIQGHAPTCRTFDLLAKEIEQVVTGKERNSSQPLFSLSDERVMPCVYGRPAYQLGTVLQVNEEDVIIHTDRWLDISEEYSIELII